MSEQTIVVALVFTTGFGVGAVAGILYTYWFMTNMWGGDDDK